MKTKNTRRTFIRNSGLAIAGLGMSNIITAQQTSSLFTSLAPSDRLNFGVIGCNGMGWANMSAHLNIPGVQCIALADVDQNVLNRRAADLKKMGHKNKVSLYKDYRKLLENKDVDVVIIGTPDHWHCLNFVDACQAGKHVYVEKPLANTIEECSIMVNAVKKYNTIAQVGQWQRSGSQYQQAAEYIATGALGNIRLVKCWAYQGWMKPVPPVADSTPPEGVDYKMWLGPAPKRNFNKNRFHFNFRWFWDYAGGLMTDWGVHEIDIALKIMQASAPKSIMASGGKLAYPNDASQTPDTLQTVFEYEDFNLLWEHATGIDQGNYGRSEGIAFIGNNGTLVVDRQGWEVMPEYDYKDGNKDAKISKMELTQKSNDALNDHAQNFVDVIKGNATELHCSVEQGAISAVNAHMGNIAFKTGEKIYWDSKTNRFKDNTLANDLVKAHYHNGWELPKV